MSLLQLGTALAAALALFSLSLAAQSASADNLRGHFADPPDDARIMMRWWWFGPSITKAEITRELEQMKAAGIGGVEVATLYPQSLDDERVGIRNAIWLSNEHIALLRFAAEEAARLGLRVDVTLGSGWPFGGAHIPVTQAAGELRAESLPVPSNVPSITAPDVGAGEQFLAAFLAPSNAGDHAGAQRVSAIRNGRLDTTPAQSTPRTALFFIASRTGMTVKRPAVGAEGFVLDHYDQHAISEHLASVGDRLLTAFPGPPPYAVFSDSLEDYGSDWTPDLLREFRARRGYDLTPHLPALIEDAGPDTAAIRHDWGRTLTELANERFLEPMHAWARQHHTLLRSQTYGYPPVTLSSNRFEDLPEGEGKATILMWREFSDTRWAASAGHLFGHNVISSETWTWLHSPAFAATPLDLKAEADLHFLQGINQLVGHGWPSSPTSVPEPGWRMYAAAALNAHNPWFFAMPDVTKYLQRVSFALRQGEPANDVALLLPNDDVWASFRARPQKHQAPTSAAGFDESGSNVTVDESMNRFLGDRVIAQVLDAGLNLDFIDADAIDSLGIQYKALILPGVDRLPAATYEKILAFAQRGGIVIATRRLPATAPGFLHHEEESAHVQQISHALFQGSVASAHFVADEPDLSAALPKWLTPDVSLSPPVPAIGFLHRRLDQADLYFVANTSNQPKHVVAQFRDHHRHVEFLDPFTGQVRLEGTGAPLNLDLEPYASLLILFTDNASSGRPTPHYVNAKETRLETGWQLSLPGSAEAARDLTALTSWTEIPGHEYDSGQAVYRQKIKMDAKDLHPGARYLLNFGKGRPLALPSPLPRFNMRAYLDSPVRDAAQVRINGASAGYVWHPPFEVDVTPFLRSGLNDVEITVGNTAINELAGQPLPDYRLLNAHYGLRFAPQDMENLTPLPSGLFGPVTLIEQHVAP